MLARYRCPVADLLERVYAAGNPASTKNRYVALTAPAHRHGYVQCLFTDSRTKILCEASSGFYYDKAGAPRTFWLTRSAIDALGRLGFSTDDSNANFQRTLEISRAPDFIPIAELMLRALHDGYGARANTRLDYNAPFAPRNATVCMPMS